MFLFMERHRFKQCRDTIASLLEFQKYQKSRFPVYSFQWSGVDLWSKPVGWFHCQPAKQAHSGYSVRGGENLMSSNYH